MRLGKKTAHSAEKEKGKVKKKTGKATGDRSLEAKGKGEQAKGGLMQAAQNIKDAFKR
ncbi:CsbD family protein [Streptomyces sp. NPDC000941]